MLPNRSLSDKSDSSKNNIETPVKPETILLKQTSIVKPLPIKKLIEREKLLQNKRETPKKEQNVYQYSRGKNQESLKEDHQLTVGMSAKKRTFKDFSMKIFIPDLNDSQISYEGGGNINEKKMKSFSKRLKYLSQLYKILLRVFFGEEVEPEELVLRYCEAFLLVHLLLRKMGEENSQKPIEQVKDSASRTAFLSVFIESFKQKPSKKRFEENIKFIFKMTIKQMKQSFQKNNDRFTSIKNIDDSFYAYYFKELADMWGLPISVFYDSANCKLQQKTLNSDYLKKLFTSTKFSNDFFSYLESEKLKSDYQASLYNKIYSILVKFDKYFEKDSGEHFDKGIKEIEKYFGVNKQCKLPWSEHEIIASINDFVASYKD